MARPCITIACVLAAVASPLAASRVRAESITVPFSVDVTQVFCCAVPDAVTRITGGVLKEGDHFRGAFTFNPDLPNRDSDPSHFGLFGPDGTFTLDVPWASAFASPTFQTVNNGFVDEVQGADLFGVSSNGHSIPDPDAMLIPILTFVDPAGAALSSTALPRSLAGVRAFPVKQFRMAFSVDDEDGSLFVGDVHLGDTSPVPEPAGVLLAGTGLLALTKRLRRHGRNHSPSSPIAL
jgi:hypothetical protein